MPCRNRHVAASAIRVHVRSSLQVNAVNENLLLSYNLFVDPADGQTKRYDTTGVGWSWVFNGVGQASAGLYFANTGANPATLQPVLTFNMGTGVALIAQELHRTGVESGRTGLRVDSAAGKQWGKFQQFRQKRTAVPTSITLTQQSATNVASTSVSSISVDGFEFLMTANAAGATQWLGTYATNG